MYSYFMSSIWGQTVGTTFYSCKLINVKILLLREKQLLMNPSHTFASHLVKMAETEQVCWNRHDLPGITGSPGAVQPGTSITRDS